MAVTVVQSNSAITSTDPATVTLGGAPTAGNTLVAIMASDTTIGTGVTAGGGNTFTQRIAQVANQGFYVYTRLVVGGESATISFDITGANPAAIAVVEVTGTYDTIGAGTQLTTSAASVTATGLTPATTDNLVLAIAGLHSLNGVNSGGSADNGFTLTLGQYAAAGSLNCAVVVTQKATGSISATGTTTVSWSSTGSGASDRDSVQIAFTAATAGSFPTVPTSGAGRILSSANLSPAGTHTFPNLSSLTKNAGDLLIGIICQYDGNSTNAEFSGWGGGFTEFVDQTTTATMAIGAAYKFSTGSETGTFTVTSADTSTNDSQCILLSIAGAHASTPPEGGTIANGTGAAANPASFNPTGWDVEKTLWIAVCGAGEDGTAGTFDAPTVAPTNYTDLFVTTVTADVVGGVYGAVAFRQSEAASDDPGGFTVDITNARNSALVLAVRPAAAAVAAGLPILVMPPRM